MSATQTAPLPAHIIIHDGKLTNCELPDNLLDDLQFYARCNGFDLEAYCQKHYGYGSELISLEQSNVITDAIIAEREERLAKKPHHYHNCTSCNRTSRAFDAGCEGKHQPGDLDEECYLCRKGESHLILRPVRIL